MKGCKTCPTSEDVWIEAARLHSGENAKAILAQAVRNIPTSVRIWLTARDLEEKPEARKVGTPVARA
jgi:pre-mRNA-processing factor 6